jgi:hypothetical protein
LKQVVLAVIATAILLLPGCGGPPSAVQEESPVTAVYTSGQPALESYEPAWLARNSTAAIVGTVLGVSDPAVLDDPPLGPRCYRDVYVEVDRCLKGAYEPGETATVRYFANGTVDGVLYEYNLALEFAEGEQVLLMISDSLLDGVPLVTASESGKFVLEGDIARRESAPPEYLSVPVSEIEAAF